MNEFRHILVPVDLSKQDRMVAEPLTPHNEGAVAKAIGLAQATDASLTFFFSLDVSPQVRHQIEEHQDPDATVFDQAEEALDHLVDRAEKAGLTANRKVVFGKSWMAITQEALRGGYDLVVAGTKHKSRLTSMLFGSTGVNLMRKCPCPVLLSHPSPDGRSMDGVVVATDFTEVSDAVLCEAALVAQALNVPIHIVHAMNIHEQLYLVRGGATEEAVHKFQEELKRVATEKFAQLMATELVRGLNVPVETHLIEGEPDVVLTEFTAGLERPLLVVGTMARSGIPGMLLGNTVERLITQVNCSLMAVKPVGFVSPVVATH